MGRLLDLDLHGSVFIRIYMAAIKFRNYETLVFAWMLLLLGYQLIWNRTVINDGLGKSVQRFLTKTFISLRIFYLIFVNKRLNPDHQDLKSWIRIRIETTADSEDTCACAGVQGAATARPQQVRRDTNPAVWRLGHCHHRSADCEEKQIISGLSISLLQSVPGPFGAETLAYDANFLLGKCVPVDL